MLNLIILLAVTIGVFNVDATSQDAGKECTWGPSFWCSSVKAAKNCGAVQFCSRNTWRQPSFTEGLHDDTTCAFCKSLVTDIKDYVTNDQTEQAIIAFVDGACAKISDKFIADECKGIANLYIVQIISMLRQQVDVTAVCRSIQLCATADMFISPINYRPHFIVNQTVLTRLAIDKLQTARVPGVFKVLASNTAKYSGSLPQSQLRPFTGNAASQCDVCKQGVEDLKIVFANAQVRDEIAQILKANICPRFVLPGECKKLIDDYAPEIFQVITGLDPEAACETIGLCQVTAEAATTPTAPLLPMAELEPARVEQPTVQDANPSSNVEASAQCILCEYVMQTIMQALADNATDQQIIHTVKNICNILPATIKPQCNQFIDMYGEELIDLITHSTDPQTICTLIGLCSNQAETTTPKPAQDSIDLSAAVKAFMNIGPVLNGFADEHYESRTNKDDKAVEADNKCFMCRIVANYLISILNENYTAQAVEAALDKVCNFLPAKLTKECTVFVDQYTTKLLAVIMSSLNTQTICQAVELCPPVATMVYENQQPGKVDAEQLVVAPFAY